MFGTLVSAVKEYSDEVKGTIKTVQDNMEQLADTSNEKFSAVANSSMLFLTSTGRPPYELLISLGIRCCPLSVIVVVQTWYECSWKYLAQKLSLDFWSV